jgi:hypothetical protein
LDSNLEPNGIGIWKVSHGDIQGTRGVPRGYHDRLLRNHEVAVYSDTARGQGEAFREQVQQGHVFYLCHGNDIKLLGRVTSNRAKQGSGRLKGWLVRRYTALRRPLTADTSYTGKQKGWTPNYNSTCMRVREGDEAQFEKRILKPFFGLTLQALQLGRHQIGDTRELPKDVGPVLTQLKKAGYEANQKVRRAIEIYAVKCATTYFSNLGYSIRPFGKPYDLECRSGKRRIYVEVKGTKSLGETVLLTKNEVRVAKRRGSRMALYVRHSVKVKGKREPTAFGGKQKIVRPWQISEGTLQPTVFQYKLP